MDDIQRLKFNAAIAGIAGVAVLIVLVLAQQWIGVFAWAIMVRFSGRILAQAGSELVRSVK